MASRMGARAETGRRNMAVMAEIESSIPTSYSSRIACMDLFPAANKLFPVSTSGFHNHKLYFGGGTDVQIA